MTIAFSDFFTRFGKLAYLLKDLFAEVGTSQNTILQGVLDSFNSDSIDIKKSLDSTIGRFRSAQSSMAAAGAALAMAPAKRMMIEFVKDDIGLYLSEQDSIREFVKQFNAGASTVELSTASASVSLGTNTGTGTVVVSDKDQFGRTCQLMLAESLSVLATSVSGDSATFRVRGEKAASPMSWEYPGGSGANFTMTGSKASDSNNFVPSGVITSTEANNANCPLGWIPTDIDATVSITSAEVQEIQVTGTPTTGWWSITVYDRLGRGYTTAPLAVGATAAQVQSAIRAITGFGSVTVTATGSTPNFTYSVSFVGVPNPGTLTVTNQTDVGTFTIPVPTSPGETSIFYRSLKITGNGSEQTSFHIPVSPASPFQYVIHALLKKTGTVSAGVLEVSLRNGIDGTLLTDDSGNNCSGTVTLSGIGANWYHFTTIVRTPTIMPPQTYLRLKCTTAINTGGFLWLNGLSMIPMQQLYAGGPSIAILDGDTAWAVGDSATVTVANDYAGELHQWMDRFYGLKSLGLQLDTSGSPTYADTLIG